MNNDRNTLESRDDSRNSTELSGSGSTDHTEPDLPAEPVSNGKKDLFPDYKPQKKDKKKRDRMLAWSIGFAAVFFLILAIMISFSIRFQLKYREYVSALSTSTTLAYDQNNLWYETDDGTFRKVYKEKMHNIYKVMTTKKGIEFKTVPENKPNLVFMYPEGALLEIWEVEPSISSNHATVLRWRFTDPKGKSWIFEGDYVSISLLMNSISRNKN